MHSLWRDHPDMRHNESLAPVQTLKHNFYSALRWQVHCCYEVVIPESIPMPNYVVQWLVLGNHVHHFVNIFDRKFLINHYGHR